MHSSKNEKDLHRKFCQDFPNGRTVMLSTLLESSTGAAGNDLVAATSPLKNQEWNALLRTLGGAIVSGFRDRVRRYDDELRRLDAKRAEQAAIDFLPEAFNLSYFFLVKESLAFTYEQMQLHEEALLQYEELEAFVPELTVGPTASAGANARSLGLPPATSPLPKSGLPRSGGDCSVDDLAAAGDVLGFRRQIRSSTDMSAIAHLLVQYLYARGCHLLFLLRRPVDVVRRSHTFVRAMHALRVKGAGRAARGTGDRDSKSSSSSVVDVRMGGGEGCLRRLRPGPFVLAGTSSAPATHTSTSKVQLRLQCPTPPPRGTAFRMGAQWTG